MWHLLVVECCTTLDIIYDVIMVAAINIAVLRPGSPSISLMFQRALWLKIGAASIGQCDNFIKSNISIVLNVSLLLFVSWQFLESVDNQARSRRYHLNLGLYVLNGPFHCNSQPLPITSSRGDVITNLFWRQAQGADPQGQDRCALTSQPHAPQVEHSGPFRVEFKQHGGVKWNWMNLNSGGQKRAVPGPSLSQRPKT